MAASVDSPSPAAHLNKESTSLMVSSPLFSPASDKRFWSALRTRVGTLLENRQRSVSISQDQLNLDPSFCTHVRVGEPDRSKRMKEDSLLLLRGFDSIAQNLSQLSNNLDNALQGARHLAEPPTLREIFHSRLESSEIKPEDEEKLQDEEEGKKKVLKRKFDPDDRSEDQGNGFQKGNEQCLENKKLKRAKNLAASMATKAAALARELKSIRSDLCFMQERCAMLEEENRRIRDGFCEGNIRPEEDDLMRLQMEALLAEKSRLANENASLKRENQSLHQLVEYHQITTQDLSASYEHVIRGMCLDFSSPTSSIMDEEEDNEDDCEIAKTPQKNVFGFATSIDESCYEGEGGMGK
ncbi:Centrosomal protein [Salix suchowensis]|nr:Centrosomal protein [Salix suchowensis]